VATAIEIQFEIEIGDNHAFAPFDDRAKIEVDDSHTPGLTFGGDTDDAAVLMTKRNR